MSTTEPTGQKIDFEPSELFFSTTDAKGRIEQANDVFVRLAGYPRHTLVGSAHNIVRHPLMPSGVYRLMWESIEAGRPFGGYVRNLSQNGSYYDVFATVMALPDGGYLSVRSRPSDEGRATMMFEAYRAIREREEQARAEGKSARECASLGALAVVDTVQALGYRDYRDFQRAVLIDETVLRESQLGGTLGLVITNTIDLIVRAALSLHAELSVLSSDQEAFEELTRRADAASQRIREARPDAASDVSNTVGELHAKLGALADMARDTQFLISLARLNSTMVTQYADERFSITDPQLQGASSEAIGRLSQALASGVDAMAGHIGALHAGIADVHESIRRLGDALDDERAIESLRELSVSLKGFDAAFDEAPLVAMKQTLVNAVAHANR